MSSEIHYEGWLTKSPPTKRIWRARWRKRWFALKQGELPGQYFLEYYTDQNCRKLKGMIELDQCEQVDAGLFMEPKFQHVFNVKTPRRTYYLAADSDDEMRYWVSCICQVCGLQQDIPKGPTGAGSSTVTAAAAGAVTAAAAGGAVTAAATEVQLPATTNSASFGDGPEPSYFNIGPGAILESPPNLTNQPSASAAANTTTTLSILGEDRTYQNNDFGQTVSKFNTIQNAGRRRIADQFNTLPNRRRQIDDIENNNDHHHEYYNDLTTAAADRSSSSTVTASEERRPPKLDALKLAEATTLCADTSEPSPALSTASGPYIPISECFSGSPVFLPKTSGIRAPPNIYNSNNNHNNSSMSSAINNNNNNGSYENHFAPLNSLDPKFYDTPRSHLNIGNLNLIGDDSKGAALATSCSASVTKAAATAAAQNKSANPADGRSSPSDSESVFTDDEMASSHSAATLHSSRPEEDAQLRSHVNDRRLRPSDSSIENEQIGLTAAYQRFSRIPDAEKKRLNSNTVSPDDEAAAPRPVPPPRPSKRALGPDIRGAVDEVAMIGPKDSSSCVTEDSYDIPRSHRRPPRLMSTEEDVSPTLTEFRATTSSTPNLISGGDATKPPIESAKIVNRSHFYTNAAPSTNHSTLLEGTVFRYDFVDADAPAVNRNLKPKSSEMYVQGRMCSDPLLEDTPPPTLEGNLPDVLGPNVNRKLKPTTSTVLLGAAGMFNSMRRAVKSTSMSVAMNETMPNMGFGFDCGTEERAIGGGGVLYGGSVGGNQWYSSHSIQLAPSRSDDKLQYLDLDLEHPASNAAQLPVGSGGDVAAVKEQQPIRKPQKVPNALFAKGPPPAGGASVAAAATAESASGRGIVYKKVDFVKTEAFKLTRQDAELNRAGNRPKE